MPRSSPALFMMTIAESYREGYYPELLIMVSPMKIRQCKELQRHFQGWVSYLGFSWCLKQQTSIVFPLRVTNGPVLSLLSNLSSLTYVDLEFVDINQQLSYSKPSSTPYFTKKFSKSLSHISAAPDGNFFYPKPRIGKPTQPRRDQESIALPEPLKALTSVH
ncbi:hypothetical protein DAPPUDRAFT_238945 [Daphnia pulex]|uniref:Uncharacterized protein n=1 Tax=Daphnia pulex TaxID=6669 RepID=E9G7V8_DAPPU|nr:hypothetical protein DAPPUDRAFT_238945 [Daphnia pulex]|eukprot:EFX84549.1 hypothetical protein DAPPUDRAFT_238945 [Daphnia pulex]